MQNFANTLIVDTPYTLAVYLLYCKEDELYNTCYFVGDNMPIKILRNLPHCFKVKRPKSLSYWNMFMLKMDCLKYRRILAKSNVYAQDHLFFSAAMLGSFQYTLIEDAPHFFDFYKNFDHFVPFYKNTLKGKLRNMAVGSNYGKILGTNSHCKNVILTSSPKNPSILKDKKSIICDLSKLWKESTTKKQRYIQEIFDIDKDDLKSGGVIIFTQPFMDDCKLTEEEQISLYAPYIEKYKDMQIVIKKHPRDKVDYLRHFPNAKIMSTSAPMQILSAMGYKFDVAVTVSSSAVSSMENAKIEWIGTSVNSKIFKVYGDIKCPV